MEVRDGRKIPLRCISANLDDKLYVHILRRQHGGRRDKRKFFPVGAMRELLGSTNPNGRTRVFECLNCDCEICDPLLNGKKNSSRLKQTKQDLEEQTLSRDPTRDFNPAIPLLATLIYLGRSCLFRYLGSRSGQYSLDIAEQCLAQPDRELIEIGEHLVRFEDPSEVSNAIECFQLLAQDFALARQRFDAAVFPLDYLGARVAPSKVLPFYEESQLGNSERTVKFRIHQDYVQSGFKLEYFGGIEDHKAKHFIRKIVKVGPTERAPKQGDRGNRLSSPVQRMENHNLMFIQKIKRDYPTESLAISDLHAWYIQKEDLNLIFPHFPSTLAKLLRESPPQNSPPPAPRGELLFSSKLWKKFLPIISTLERIHSPSRESATPAHTGFHFNIKPSNIVEDDTGRLLITDFGTVRFSQGGAELGGSESPVLTTSVGDSSYKPPERVAGLTSIDDNTRKYDVWSVACVIAEVITFIVGYRTTRNGELLGFPPGSAAVREFSNDRIQDSKGTSLENESWWQWSKGDPRPELKPSVKKWLISMQTWADDPNRCNGTPDRYLKEVMKLLERMFSLAKEDRPTSATVNSELKRIQTKLEAEARRLKSQPESPEDILEKKLKARYGEEAVVASRAVRPTPNRVEAIYENESEPKTIEQFVALDHDRSKSRRIVVATSELEQSDNAPAPTGPNQPAATQTRTITIESASRQEEEFFPHYLFAKPKPNRPAAGDEGWTFSLKMINPDCIYKFPCSRLEEDKDDIKFFRLQDQLLHQALLVSSQFSITKLRLGDDVYEPQDRLFSLNIWVDYAWQKARNKDRDEKRRAKAEAMNSEVSDIEQAHRNPHFTFNSTRVRSDASKETQRLSIRRESMSSSSSSTTLTPLMRNAPLNIYDYQIRLVLCLPRAVKNRKPGEPKSLRPGERGLNRIITIRLDEGLVELCDGLMSDKSNANGVHFLVATSKASKRQREFRANMFFTEDPQIPSIPVTPQRLDELETAKDACIKGLEYLDITFEEQEWGATQRGEPSAKEAFLQDMRGRLSAIMAPQIQRASRPQELSGEMRSARKISNVSSISSPATSPRVSQQEHFAITESIRSKPKSAAVKNLFSKSFTFKASG